MTPDAGMRQRLGDLLQEIEPPPAPLETIIRRGRGIRLRRTGAAAGALGLAGIVAAATVLASPTGPGEAGLPVTVPASGTAGPDGVFASGSVNGHAWRLAVQNIADPGYRCIPAITINGTDADPVDPSQGHYATVALGPAYPGIGFAFVQVRGDVGRLVLDGRQGVPATAVTACGEHYRLVGFAYRLARPPQVTAVGAGPGGPAGYQIPLVSARPPAASVQTDGMWNNVGPTGGETASGVIASGRSWSIQLLLDVGGDCYEFSSADSAGSPDTGACGPISTPDGPETIMALPLSYPPAKITAPTGYALQVSPATAHLSALLSDGSTQLVTPRVVDGRKYAAFAVPASLQLECLTWLDAGGAEIASTFAVPHTGYTQFQP